MSNTCIISISYRIVSKIVALCCSVKNRCTKPSKCLGKSSHLRYVKFVSIITVPDPVIGGHCVLLKCLFFYLSTFCCFGFLEIPAGSPSKGRFLQNNCNFDQCIVFTKRVIKRDFRDVASLPTCVISVQDG